MKPTLAEKIKFSLLLNQHAGLRMAQRRMYPNYVNVNKYGSFEFNNNLNTIQRKLQLLKNMKQKEKNLLVRLYDPNYYGGNRNNTKIKPVRNWYIGVLAKKYKVPVEWFQLNPALIGSKRGRHIEYMMTKIYTPSLLTFVNSQRAKKQLARKLSRAYVSSINRRVQAAKKTLEPLRGVNELRSQVLNTAFPHTTRHRSPSVGRLFSE
jgi:hypothetical protein